MKMHDINYVRKVTELSNRVLNLIEISEALTRSDLQSAIDAVIIEAIQYGKDGAK